MMPRVSRILEGLKNGNFDKALLELYCKEELLLQKKRYEKLLLKHKELFGDKDVIVVSAPGRTELGGNHTDHNNGNVLAASVEFDSVCVISKNSDNSVNLHSEGYDKIVLNLSDISYKTEEKETTTALLKGIIFRFLELNYKIDGFNCNMDSQVFPGSGLSSSASIEIMLGTALSELFNNGKTDYVEIAKIGQFAENNFFGKASGLMDQIACAAGGIVGIDFKNSTNPKIEPIKFSFKKEGYQLMVTNVKSSHANLSDEYSSVPTEMKSVARVLGSEHCNEISISQLIENVDKIRDCCGDRALLRAFHFITESKRAVLQLQSLKDKNFSDYLRLVEESGSSSYKYLQNIYVNSEPKNQSVSIGLAFSEFFLKGVDPMGARACRIQGGGFAGTIQAYVPQDFSDDYKKLMDSIFGGSSCFVLKIRDKPACMVF